MKISPLILLTLMGLALELHAALIIPAEIPTSTIWTAADNPIIVPQSTVVRASAILTIEPGVEIQLAPDVAITFQGTLNAIGSAEQPIVFKTQTSDRSWRRLDFSAGSGPSRFNYCVIDGAGSTGNIRGSFTTLYLDHVTFTNTTAQMLTVDDSSVDVRNCVFPSIQNNELIHFDDMPPEGFAIFDNNTFGTTTGYNDIIDFTGGNRPGPIAQFYNNLFFGAVDDVLDFDGTDAHVEGNFFVNVRQDAARASSANAVSSGADSGQISELMIVRNVFYNVDHALLLKDGGRAVMQQNTILKVQENPLDSLPIGVISWGETNRGVPPGRSLIFEKNLVSDAIAFVVNQTGRVEDLELLVRFNRLPWSWPGESNVVSGIFPPQQVITIDNAREVLGGLRGTGGAALNGGPINPEGTEASFNVGGPGIVSYKYRLNGGSWSDETALTNNFSYTTNLFGNGQPLIIAGVAAFSPTRLEVIGKNSAGLWQTEPGARGVFDWNRQAQTSPLISIAKQLDGSLQIRFQAEAGKQYSLLSRETFAPGSNWMVQSNIPIREMSGEEAVTIIPSELARFFLIGSSAL